MPLIDLSDAVNVVEGYRDRNPDSWSLCNSIKFDIAELPTISPDEVRGVGEWTNKRTIEHDGDWWCTACGKEITIYMGKDRKNRYAFCPNCGARMKGGAD